MEESLHPTGERPPNAFTEAVGARVRQAREDAGLSQTELARLASVHRNTISNVEAGKVELSVSTLVMFALVLHRPLSYFIPLPELSDARLPDDSITMAQQPVTDEWDGPDEEIGVALVESEIQPYEAWKADNALKLAQVLAWIRSYSTIDREPTDQELADVRLSLLRGRGTAQGESTVREIAEEWIRQNTSGDFR